MHIPRIQNDQEHDLQPLEAVSSHDLHQIRAGSPTIGSGDGFSHGHALVADPIFHTLPLCVL